ncbi:MAG: polyphosphate polymerase domain-containing protein [Actinomycetaceae bacterium]|nr:polyphosphate polymerase domain-containing protein [Actinomycetaceae bacterium]
MTTATYAPPVPSPAAPSGLSPEPASLRFPPMDEKFLTAKESLVSPQTEPISLLRETDTPLMTPTENIYALFGQFAPISLDELVQEAALLKRVDRKYMVSVPHVLQLLDALRQTGARVLEIDGKRHFHYISDYFDTADFDLYRAAATKRRKRYKVRERFYCDSGEHFLEVKIRDGRGNNVKKRMKCAPVSPSSVRTLRTEVTNPYTFSFDGTDEGAWIAKTFTDKGVLSAEEAQDVVKRLEPCVRTAYARSTLLLPDGPRLTCDLNVQASSLMPKTLGDELRNPYSEIPFVIIETKSAQRPSLADKLLWGWGVRPIKISKYAFGVATQHNQKANKWTKALRRIEQAA